jgi:hypothetical protein
MQDMSKLLQLNDMWQNKSSSGHGQELPSGVRESSYVSALPPVCFCNNLCSYIENPDAPGDVRTRVGFIVATQVRGCSLIAGCC